MAHRRFVWLIGAAAAVPAALASPPAADAQDVFKRPAQVVVQPAEAQQGGDPDDNPLVAVMRQHLEPRVKVELSFANRACRWTPDQRQQAVSAALDFLKAYSRQAAQQNQQVNRGMVLFVGAAPANIADPVADFPVKLAETLEGTMTAEQRAAYRAAQAERTAFRTAAVVENIVSQMDQRLELSPEQRRKLVAALRKNWRDQWTPPLQLLVQMTNYSPAVPDEHVLPLLTPEQRTAWQGVQKISARGSVFGGGIFGGGEQTIDDIDLSETP